MPFLTRNNLLIDPIARTVVPRITEPDGCTDASSGQKQIVCQQSQKQSRPIVQQTHHVRVGNALMQVPECVVHALSRHAVNTGRSPPKTVTHRYTIKLACCAITMDETRYKELNPVFMTQYSDIFSKTLPSRLPPEGCPMHRIIL